MSVQTSAREYIDTLKQRVGSTPFTSRGLRIGDKQPCPFHGGDDGFAVRQDGDGIWRAYCHSGCPANPGHQFAYWDAIAFVMKKDSVDFKEAVARLGGRVGSGKPADSPETEKAKPVPITHKEWSEWGHEPTAEDIALFEKNRKDTTAGAETWAILGCRVKDGLLGSPYRLRLENGEYKYFTVKTRPLTGTKENNFGKDDIRHLAVHCVNSNSLFNLDDVSYDQPVYVVEGEPDVAIMTEAGYCAVGVMSASQAKFDKAQIEILCEASHIFLVGDQKQRGVSDPGSNAMDALADLLPPGKFHRISFSDGKDVCELARIYGGTLGLGERISELTADALVPWVSKNVPSVNRILNLNDPRWLIDRMIPYKGVTIFCSPQGGYKTTFALALCMALRGPLGRDFKFLGRPITPYARKEFKAEEFGEDTKTYIGASDYPICYIDRENPPEVVGSRLRRMGLVGDNEFLYWGDDDKNETPDVNDSRLEEWVKATKGVILFDSLQDWYGDAKEIDNSAMVKLMHGFRRLARLGAGVIILHHTSKEGTVEDMLEDMRKFYRGGTGIVSIPDMAIGMAKEMDTGLLHLGEIRFRMSPEWRLMAKVDWDLGDGTGIKISVVEDLDAKQLRDKRADRRDEKAAKRQEGKDTKRREKEAALDSEVDTLVRAAKENPKASVRQLEKDTGIGRNLIGKRLARRGWKQVDGIWCGPDEAEVAVEQGAL